MSVFERLAVRTIRFSNRKFEMKITLSSSKNSVVKQLKERKKERTQEKDLPEPKRQRIEKTPLEL